MTGATDKQQRTGAASNRALRAGPVALAILAAAGLWPASAAAEQARFAVAANFTAATKQLAEAFAATGRRRVVFSFGSTGQLYTQITQGAPFDGFLAADQARPAAAIAKGLAVPGSRFTYATGRLALYSRSAGMAIGRDTLQRGNFRKIAIANPATAPYGAAAVAAMKALGVYDRLAGKIVRGGNVAQAHQFVATGNAELGFVALSQIVRHEGGSRWIVPADLHAPIAQDAVLLKRGAKNMAAVAFLAFVKSPQAAAIIESLGYGAGGL